MYIQLDKSDRREKKYKAVFYDETRRKILTSHFGQAGASDYTYHQDDERKNNYLQRHSRESWNDPTTPATLSRYLLWNRKSLSASFNDYLKLFNLKRY